MIGSLFYYKLSPNGSLCVGVVYCYTGLWVRSLGLFVGVISGDKVFDDIQFEFSINEKLRVYHDSNYKISYILAGCQNLLSIFFNHFQH